MHIRLTTITTPNVFKSALEELSKRKYPVEGKLRKGYAQCHIATMQTLDIRAKKEIVPQVITDLCALDLGNETHLGGVKRGQNKNNVTHHINPLVRFVVVNLTKIVRKLTGHFVPEYNTDTLLNTKKKIPAKGWMYSFIHGCYKDPEQVLGNEEL